MSGTDFPFAAAWTLRERLDRPARGPVDAERGARRADRWFADEPFAEHPELLDRRLALDGLDRDGLRERLGEQTSVDERTEEEAETAPPPWVDWLGASFAAEVDLADRVAPPRHLQRAVGLPFWGFVEPLVRRAVRELDDRLRELARIHPDGPLREGRIEALTRSCIPGELLEWSTRTLVLEMNIARLRGDLTAEDPRERFRAFAESLNDAATSLAIYGEVPVLGRQLVEFLRDWIEVTYEVCARLVADWSRLPDAFDLAADDELARLWPGAGDRHRGGRSVVLLTFASGRRLVYKPRSLAVAVEFQNLLRTLGDEDFEPWLRPLAVVDRESHGYMEFVVAEPCRSAEEVHRFYLRQGALLALLYALRATDIHFENVVAVGEQPQVIDLESLLQPGPPVDDPLADALLRDSLVEVGLLPVRNWENESSPGLDVSGMGGPEGQVPPRPEPFWAEHGTDTMHFSRQERAIQVRSHHRPTVDGRPAAAIDHVDAIVEGFSRLYRHLAAHRDAWLAEDGPLAAMLRHPVRVLPRPTAVYGLMLRESFHPDVLRDSLDRQRFFDKLWKQVPHRPFLERLIPAEQAALQRRDVPLFTALPSSRDLFGPADEVIEDLFSRSAEELIVERFRGFDERDLDRQVWFVRASLALLSTDDPEHGEAPPPRTERATGAGSSASAEEVAASLGRQLVDQAREDAEDVRWIGLRPAPRGAFKIGYLDDSLYGGQAGVTLFLAWLGELAGDREATRLARASCEAMLRRADEPGDEPASLGAFTGAVGLAYVLDQLAALWHEAEWRERGLDRLAQVTTRIEQDDRFDVINGSAGVVLAASAIAARGADARIDRLIERAGEHLLASAVDADGGRGWVTTHEAAVPLAGFSHGVAGIAAALYAASAHTGDARFREQARHALAYERGLFRADTGNWLDLRGDETALDPVNWCHGAPGIALSRALILRHEPSDEAAREEIRVAARTTLDRGFGRNHCLCHGDLGNLDVLTWAAAACPDLGLDTEIERLGREITTDIARNGWRSGLPMAVETPGLMVGAAGIGLGLLRLVAPERVPSVPALAPSGAFAEQPLESTTAVA